jgi:hypothetical protein
VSFDPFGQHPLVIKWVDYKKVPDTIGPGESGYIVNVYRGYGRGDYPMIFVVNRIMNKPDIESHKITIQVLGIF